MALLILSKVHIAPTVNNHELFTIDLVLLMRVDLPLLNWKRLEQGSIKHLSTFQIDSLLKSLHVEQ